MSEWIYSRTRDNKARFLLGESGRRPLVCIGINPSTAEPNRLDRTLATVKRFASDHGFDGWLMLNVYPQRATDPNNLSLKKNSLYHRRNLDAIDRIFRNENFQTDIWAAWGTLIMKRDYLFPCLVELCAVLQAHRVRWHTIGRRSRDGHPHHPLYLKKESALDRFNVGEYLRKVED